MTSENNSNKARDVILLVGLVFFVLTGLGTEIVSCESTSGCDVCGSHRRERTRHWGIWGAVGSNQTENSLQPSRFLKDFPEFQCSHQWSFEDKIEEKVWDSPLIGLTHPHGIVGYSIITCCGFRERPVWERYETDEAYRYSIQELLQTGAATREQLIALAMESEDSREEVYTPEEEAILKTLYPRPYGCPAGSFKPLELPFMRDFTQRNERPPI